jgi:two-component system, OmpR family, sensor histidine kinase KdpD
VNPQPIDAKLQNPDLRTSAVTTDRDDIRATLIATVSHDLRAPLATAMAAVDTLAVPAASWSSDDESALMRAVRTSLAQMSRLVEGLLDSARIDHGSDSVRLVPTELVDVVAGALASVPEAHTLAVQLPTELAGVVTDPLLLERVIANVVANALRFSPTGSHPQLIATRGAAWIEMRVVDHGPGVPPEQLQQIFKPFRRLDQPGTGSGLGLGLAIAQTLATAIGAEIHAEPTAGGGLTMVVALPCTD